MNIDLEIDLNQKVDISVHVGDVIHALNEMPIHLRWNYCAKIINDVNLKDGELSSQQKEIIEKWLNNKLNEITNP